MDNPEHIGIELTPEQIARVLALSRHHKAEDLATELYRPVIVMLDAYNCQLWHSGGGLFMVRIEASEFTWDDGSHPYVLIDRSEVGAWWRVGAYLDGDDEGGEFLYGNVRTELLPGIVAAAFGSLKEQAITRTNIEEALALPLTTAEAIEWAVQAASDGEMGTHPLDEEPLMRGWKATRVMGPVHMPFVTFDHYADQNAIGNSDWFPEIIRLEATDETELWFIVRWHDGVTGEWREVFGTHEEAVDYFADLTKAVLMNKHIDEVRPPALPGVWQHMKDAHPRLAWRVRVWWDDPQTTTAVVRWHEETNQMAMIVDYGDGRGAGDASPDTNYICDICDADLSLELDVDLISE